MLLETFEDEWLGALHGAGLWVEDDYKLTCSFVAIGCREKSFSLTEQTAAPLWFASRVIVGLKWAVIRLAACAAFCQRPVDRWEAAKRRACQNNAERSGVICARTAALAQCFEIILLLSFAKAPSRWKGWYFVEVARQTTCIKAWYLIKRALKRCWK